ncbi:MAG: SDR family oxidoreductase [Abitibacteriaceae bacterium]|nr:SDR family oxidoreductase [Abditibacteriaceae bacterium]MBV9867009.1 SDR family oxidoreductase [Abditibacteriaceae bacterium]
MQDNPLLTQNVLESFRLDGRRALVTGGTKGLGLIMATALAQAGAEVAVVSRTLTECQMAAKSISQATGRRAIAVAADVTKAEEVSRMVEQVEAELGTVDILINNAGINVRGSAQELLESDWDDVIAINLKAPFLCARALGPGMCERGWGRVINMGSILSVIGIPGRAPYGSAKAGLLNLTRVLALEWATQGVTVNAICPGPFATDMNKPLLNDPEKYKAFVQKIPMGRWGELNEIAGAAIFLASPAASFVTGSGLFVDGGWTAQ